MAYENRTPDERIKFWKGVLKNNLNKYGEPLNKREKLYIEAKIVKAQNDKKNGNIEKLPFVKMDTKEKNEFGKLFTPQEKKSYRNGQRNAYSHMANIARSESSFISDNIIVNSKK